VYFRGLREEWGVEGGGGERDREREGRNRR